MNKTTDTELLERFRRFKMAAKSVQTLCTLLGTDRYSLERMGIAPRYKTFHLPKNEQGDVRLIEDPPPAVKKVQNALNYFLQSVYYFEKSYAGYGFVVNPITDEDKRNILTNARKHLKNPWMIQFDIRDFFHAVTTDMVLKVFSEPPLCFKEDVVDLLTAICTYQGRLPMGSPASPVVTQSCAVHSSAIELAAAHEIPIFFMDRLGKVTARVGGPAFQSIATLRRQQAYFTNDDGATRWVTVLYLLKTEGQANNLERLKKQHPAASTMRRMLNKADAFVQLPLAIAGPKIMAMEAAIARQYWQALAQWLPPECDFEKRSRRPAQDNFNAALNYLYGMLYTVVESGIFAAGLDPYLGLLHAEEYNKPVLAFDFIEPFRPWVDWFLIEQFVAGKVTPDMFMQIPDGVILHKAGKAFFIPLFNAWLRTERTWGGRKTNVRNHIYQLAGRFAQKLREKG